MADDDWEPSEYECPVCGDTSPEHEHTLYDEGEVKRLILRAERAEAQVKLLRASLVKLRDRVDSISADVDQALADAGEP